MLCIKCHKEIADDSVYCNYCGKKQVTTKRSVRRRPRGTGCIRYRKDCKNNPYIAYTPAAGSGVGSRYLGSYPTAKAAQAALDRYFNDTHINYSALTVAQIYSTWSEKHFETLSRSGAQSYKTAWNYLKDISSRRIAELKTADYQRCIDSCAVRNGRDQCDKVKQLCSQLCKFSMQNDIIDKNYAEFIKLLKAEPKEKRIFTADERQILWAHSDDKRVQIILFMIYTGWRIGEALSLRKEEIDFEKGFMVGGLKTEAGRNRIVPFPESVPEIKGFVRKWYEESKTEKLLNFDVSNFRKRQFYPVLEELGINTEPKLTPHSCRHTFATLSADCGIRPEKLQKIIGHVKYETTADVYIHADRDKEELISEMKKLKK